MAIECQIDHDRRMVFARGLGTLTDQDFFGYQREVWSRADVAGYDELMDMSDVTEIALPSCERVRNLATLSATTDDRRSNSKFAIIAPNDLAFRLGRMYQAYRGDEREQHQEGRRVSLDGNRPPMARV